MSTLQEKKESYADIALNVGVNIQKGQTLFIRSPLFAADFVRIVARKAYQAGAKHVRVDWSDEELTRTKFELAPEEAFSEFPEWYARALEEEAEDDAAFLSITGGDPDLLKGIDAERIATANKTSGRAMDGFRSYIQSDKVSWSIVAVPSVKWAERVFPEAKGDEAVEKLWEAIFAATRVNESDPVTAWQEHLQTLDEKMETLNDKHFHALHYTAEGTDLTIELPETHLWASGGSVSKAGVNFVANIPTEEVFTAARKKGVNGKVSSKKPLNYGGTLITDFTLTFENGLVVDFEAKEGEETLKNLLEGDDGASYIGEVALVPHRSPISDTNIIFFNTLFDENASNHLALGSAYAFNIEGGKDMDKAELEEKGLNTSITHVDFMVGDADMDIDGIHEDGTREPVFRNGDWAF
ncbi:aminopeptidase [Natribacillus halophilus]|uniref:Aminopeptidase II. Metallo peptidase. MEROPS family M29 n=1 Tax=Natribacillus halophilus TaxID=549003 RepID=A0A1G8NJM5_9BACI|nr:aminopeptidase [Natribacillus halophilus]SDI80342.1 aminopeptidase II. Metallo peptidase. MEROPS family M29 [Natribacillus halophilus]